MMKRAFCGASLPPKCRRCVQQEGDRGIANTRQVAAKRDGFVEPGACRRCEIEQGRAPRQARRSRRGRNIRSPDSSSTPAAALSARTICVTRALGADFDSGVQSRGDQHIRERGNTAEREQPSRPEARTSPATRARPAPTPSRPRMARRRRKQARPSARRIQTDRSSSDAALVASSCARNRLRRRNRRGIFPPESPHRAREREYPGAMAPVGFCIGGRLRRDRTLRRHGSRA